MSAMQRIAIMQEISGERRRQNALRDAGEFPATARDLAATGEHGDLACALAVLLEEVGEVAREVNEWSDDPTRSLFGTSRGRLRDELVQVAAVAVAWIEGLDAMDGDS